MAHLEKKSLDIVVKLKVWNDTHSMDKESLIKEVQVKNALGLHTRPATHIVKLLQDSKSEIFFTHNNETINAKSILSILMLAAQKDAHITIEIKGEDAQATMDRLLEAFDNGFGEEVKSGVL